jgi:type II secretory pathway predicted ATPase ExeA/HAMP domain-containing protein
MTELLSLDEDVESHFGFRETPFGVTPDPRFFYSNPVYVKALAALVYGIKVKKGFMLLTGEVGTGKTILLRKLMRNLEATVRFVFVSGSHLTSYGLVELMVQDLGLASKVKPRLEMIQELHGYLLQQLRSGHTVALLIDEAQNLSDGALEGLCDLSNLETDNEKLLQIVLVGQPELVTKLSTSSMRRIKQRIAIQHRLSALQTMEEVEHYIRHRLHVAGYDGPEIFTKEAIEAIWLYSAGTPRLVNIICDNSLALACEAANQKVSAYMVMKAASGFQLEQGVEVPEIGAPEIAVAPAAGIKPETETNGTEVKIGDQSEAPEVAVAPAIGIKPETVTNETEVKMGDRSEAPPVSLRAPEPVAVSPTEAKPPADSAEFFDHTTPAATETRAPMTSLVFDDQITARGESRDTFRQKKLGELTALVGRLNETRFQTRIGLKWKIGGAFTGVMLILCTFVAAAAYQIIQHTLRDQFDKRALAIATNLSDAAAGHIVGKNLLALNALARKYTLLDGVAYAFIEDGKGDIVAQTLGTFPAELRQGLPVGGRRLVYQRELSLQKKTVYETSVPVLEGQIGIVHVGFWADAMEKEIQRALLPLIGIIAIVPFIGALLSFLVAHWFVRPIVRLTEAAEKVTRGDLEAGGECVKSRDEIGDLARSLERMRASLKAAMLRLGRA